MTTRRGFLGKLAGLAAAPLAKKIEIPKLGHADSGFLGPGGKLVDDETQAQAIHGLVAGKTQRLVPCYPQNVGQIAEGGNFPPSMGLASAFPVTLYNPTSEPVTESYHGNLVTVMPKGHARLTIRDQPIDDAHRQALIENQYQNLQPEEPEFYDDCDHEDYDDD